jgi:hypothetical protein
MNILFQEPIQELADTKVISPKQGFLPLSIIDKNSNLDNKFFKEVGIDSDFIVFLRLQIYSKMNIFLKCFFIIEK